MVYYCLTLPQFAITMATHNLQSVVVDTDTVILPITDRFHTDSQLNTYTIESIQFHLDSDIKDLSAEWMASIPFSCTVIHEKNPFIESHPPIPSLINICDYLAGQKYPASRLSFCFITSPCLCRTMNCLLTNLLGGETYPVILPKLLMQRVTPLSSMDCKKSNKDMNHNHVFRCTSFHRSTRTKAMELTDEYQYRNTSLLNDRRNNRKQSQHCPKHMKMVDRKGGCTCKFQFMVKWDLHAVSILTCNKRRAILIIHHIPKYWILAPFHSQHVCSHPTRSKGLCIL
jgi:hypothetical protein